jgi:hypothetical protein
MVKDMEESDRNLRYYIVACVEGLRKNTKIVSQVKRSTRNIVAGVLTTQALTAEKIINTL